MWEELSAFFLQPGGWTARHTQAHTHARAHAHTHTGEEGATQEGSS